MLRGWQPCKLRRYKPQFWALGSALVTLTAFMSIIRKLYREFPIFFAYLITRLLRTVATLITTKISSEVYYYSYLGFEALDAVMSLAVIEEIFSHVFRPYEALRRFSRIIYRWAVLLLVGIAIATAWVSPGSETDHMAGAWLNVERSVSLVQCGLLVLLFLLGRQFALGFRSYALGIGIGFGITASIIGTMAELRAHIITIANFTYAVLVSSAFTLGIVIWVGYLLRGESAATTHIERTPNDLESWNNSLARMMKR